MFSDDFLALESTDNLNLSLLFSQFVGGDFANDPLLAVDSDFDIIGVWVYPHVCHAVDGLRPKGGCGKVGIIYLELQKGVFFGYDSFAYLTVMVTCGALVMGTPNHRICSSYDIPLFSQPLALPLNKLAEGWAQGSCVKFSSPIY